MSMYNHFSFIVFVIATIESLVIPGNAWAQTSADCIWLEGESPSSVVPADLKLNIGNGPKDVLSQGKWLTWTIDGDKVDKSIPDTGIELHYAFQTTNATDYNLWIHVGYEQARSPFDWRIDNGPWQEVSRNTPTVDVQELGVWAPVSWMNLGKQSITTGGHEIALRIHKSKNREGKFGTWLVGIDALCITSAPFHPDGVIKPGDTSWMTDADKTAAAQTFNVPLVTDAAQMPVSLKGQWQYSGDDERVVDDRLGPTKALPDAQSLNWHAMAIPGDRNKLIPANQYVHRYYLRTRIAVPAELSGRSFVMHIPDLSMVATLFVNGQPCGWTKNTGAPWDCDVTRAIKPGQTNEIQFAIKDAFYGLDLPAGNNPLEYIPYSFWHNNTTNQLDMPVLGNYFTGLLRAEPSLVVAGPVYTNDVFAKPSLKQKSLGLEVTVHNPTDKPVDVIVSNEVEPLKGGPAEKTFAPSNVTIAPGQDATVNLTEEWTNPKLWWPDDPQQYNIVTRLSVGGKSIDERKTKFGFREWTWDGPDFKLNGIPWHGFADCNNAPIPTLKARGQTMVRVWSPDNSENYLDECDALGMPVRRTSIFDGEGSSGFYNLTNPHLWDNYRQQMVVWMKAQRNHPSIFLWSIENEITFINGHVFGQDALTTREIGKSFKIFSEVDPTRPEMTDGGNALLDESMPVYGGHYMEPPFNTFPESIYDRDGYTHREGWPINQPKPILFGEAEYLAGDSPAELATVGGEEAALGPAESRPARGAILRMLSEGYRWIGFSFQFWTGDETNFYNAWSPSAVLCRQWDWTFNSGQTVNRTMGIFNDTRLSEPLIYNSILTLAGKEISRDSSVHTIAPGGNEKFDVKLTVPAVTERQEGTWTLTLSRAGKTVFEDVKNFSVLPPVAAIVQAALPPAGIVALFDPQGNVKQFLKSAGFPATSIENLNQIPGGVKVLIIGDDALDIPTSTSSQLSAWASTGKVLIVLEQKNPLKFQALPGEMETDHNHGCLAFAEDMTSPVFDGLQQKDLSNWGPYNWTYRDAYVKPTSGGKSLVQCDNRLRDTALAQMQVGNGLMLLSQLLIGETIQDGAVAQRLLLNMVNYGINYKLIYRDTAVVADSNPQLIRALDSSGLQYDKVADVLAAVSKAGSVAVIDASPSNLSAMVGNISQVNSFTEGGGWIILNRLTPEGLADFNKLVGVDHLIRPFRAEKVTFSLHRHPLTAGLSAANVVLSTGKKIMWQASPEFADPNAYSYVVDLDDIAPFGKSTYGSWNNAVNGFTQKDGAWQLIQNLVPEDAVMPITLPRTEKIEQIIWCSDTNYEGCKRIDVEINGKTYSFDTQPNGDEQAFVVPDEPNASALTIRVADWEHNPAKLQGGKELVGIDNIWIKVARSPDFSEKVKPMLNIGALVEYPQGKGGIILCNVKFRDSEENPENTIKKRTVIATLLRNLLARFSGGRTIIAGSNLQFSPIDISKFADQFRGEQGWFGDRKHTFEALPPGKQTMAGVTYDIYSFKTSIVPEAIMLKGNGIPGILPDVVTGIPVNQKADALFFLQAAKLETRMNDRDRHDGKKFEMADYLVHYANASTETIPIYAEINVDDFHQKSPTPIPGAQIAWQQSYGPTDGYAVAYSMQWTNPHPDVEIASIDLVYGPQRRGVPAVLAITAAKAP